MDIRTKTFIDNAKDLVKELELFKNTLFKSFPGYSDTIFDLNNSLDFIKIQYDDINNDEQTNQEIVAKFAERYFKALTKLLTIVKGINQGNDESIKEKINKEFHDTAIKIVKLIGEYGSLLKYYSDDMVKTVNIATKEFNKVRDTVKKNTINKENNGDHISSTSSYVLQSIPNKEEPSKYSNNLISSNNVSSKPSTNMLNYNSTSSNTNKTDYSNDFANLFGESLNLINEWFGLEDSARDVEYSKALELYERTGDWDKIWNGNFSTTTKYAMYFNTAIDNVGVFMKTSIDSFGNLCGRLFVKVADGAEHTAECFDVINEKGFDGFLNDDKCMGNKTVTKI